MPPSHVKVKSFHDHEKMFVDDEIEFGSLYGQRLIIYSADVKAFRNILCDHCGIRVILRSYQLKVTKINTLLHSCLTRTPDNSMRNRGDPKITKRMWEIIEVEV